MVENKIVVHKNITTPPQHLLISRTLKIFVEVFDAAMSWAQITLGSREWWESGVLVYFYGSDIH